MQTFKIQLNSLILKQKNKFFFKYHFFFIKNIYFHSKRGKGLFNLYARNNLFFDNNINNEETTNSYNY